MGREGYKKVGGGGVNKWTSEVLPLQKGWKGGDGRIVFSHTEGGGVAKSVRLLKAGRWGGGGWKRFYPILR